MIQNHVYVFGDIYNDQSKSASDWGIVSKKSVVDQINANPSADELIVHIHSRGGDVMEGFAIHDALVNSGKKVITVIEGLCASIATVVALAGSTRRMTENSEFMIHNPWGDPFSMDGFTADDYEKRAEEIRQAEDKLVAFYVNKTGADESMLRDMMGEETTMAPDKALEMKFITEITNEVKAFALLKAKNKNKTMSKSKLQAAIDLFSKGIKALQNGVSGLTLSTTDGKSLDIDQDGDIPQINSNVTIEGQPAPDADYALSTGTTITVKGGKISAIKATEAVAAAPPAPVVPPVTPPPAPAADVAALTAQLATAQARITELEAAETGALAQMTTMLSDLKNLKSKFVPEGRVAAPVSGAGSPVEESRAAAAVKRAKEAREAKAAAEVKVTA